MGVVDGAGSKLVVVLESAMRELEVGSIEAAIVRVVVERLVGSATITNCVFNYKFPRPKFTRKTYPVVDWWSDFWLLGIVPLWWVVPLRNVVVRQLGVVPLWLVVPLRNVVVWCFRWRNWVPRPIGPLGTDDSRQSDYTNKLDHYSLK